MAIQGLILPVVILLGVFGGGVVLGRQGLALFAGVLVAVELVVFGYFVWSYNAADNDVDLMVTGLAAMGLGACLLASGIGWLTGRAWRNRAKRVDG